jgi:hypothetical protein
MMHVNASCDAVDHMNILQRPMEDEMRWQWRLYAAVLLFLGALAVSWITHGTGIVRNDPERHIAIPSPLTMPLQVKAAYNDQDMFLRYRWPSPRPGIHHDVLRFQGGKWVVQGEPVPGSEPNGLAEDRLAMMLDDGGVPEFARYGGYIAIGDGITSFSQSADTKAVRAHADLGQRMKQAEVSKYLPATRKVVGDWSALVSEADLAAQRKAGYFLDLWHWRAHRSNPLNISDDQFVAAARFSDTGRSPYATNWNGETKQPRLMLDQSKVGKKSLRWDDIAQKRLGFADVYYLRADQAVAFDPNAGWTEGDTLPRRILAMADKSRGDIAVDGEGRWSDGYWDVTLRRRLDTGNPLEDKVLRDQGAYQVAFSVHREAQQERWHYVSLPVTLGLNRPAGIVAPKFAGAAPDWQQPWSNVTLFYPGQVSWPHLNSAKHAGAENIRLGVPVKYRHSEAQLAHYGVEAEFADAIRRQWLLTLLAGVALIAGFGVSLNLLLQRKQGV